MSLYDVSGFVNGSVVDDHNLENGTATLIGEVVEERVQRSRSIVGRHDH